MPGCLKKVALLLATTMILPVAARSQNVPDLISLQGVLKDRATGAPVADGTHSVVFSIYSAPTGGSAIWSETQTVETRNGVFKVLLGSAGGTSPNFAGVLNGAERYLGVKVGADSEMERERIASVGYAFRSADAEKLGGRDAASFLSVPFSAVETSDGGVLSEPAFGLTTTRRPTALFKVNNATSNKTVLEGRTNGSGSIAGLFVSQNESGTSPALVGRAHSSGAGVMGVSRGMHARAGYFETVDADNIQYTMYVINRGLAPAAKVEIVNTSSTASALDVRNFGHGYAAIFGGSKGVQITADADQVALDVLGRTKTSILEITGGSDLSEQFEVNAPEVQPGMIVSIDPERPGELAVSARAYDRRVAGIISGAGGVKTGMLMGQTGTVADGEHPVALTGRVYCRADASFGEIEPGDLLTTSDTPGHAMKVTDHDRAGGAIIGKAMTGLDDGRGLVLVLVSLQ